MQNINKKINTPPSYQTVGNGGRAVGLDLMRISMALLIFMFHSRIHILHCSYGVFNSFVEMGAIAMTGFFLLSGYVLNLTYGKKDMSNTDEIKRFYLKRIIAIIPLYFAWALFVVVAKIVIRGGSIMDEIVLFPIEFLGIQSVFSTLFPFSHNSGSWFISCLLICYFLYPLIHIITNRIIDKNRIWLVLLLSVVLLWSPFVQHYFELQTIYTNPFFRALEFIIGILVSQLNNSIKPCKLILLLRNPFVCVVSIVSLIVGVTVAKQLDIPGDYMLYSWVALPCFISMIVSLGSYRFSDLQGSKTIRYFSDLSFCLFLGQVLYVWYAVKFSLEFVGCQSNILKIVMSFILVFILANVLHYLVEVPSTKYLKQRLLTNK